jgi:hypothetical protein
VGAQEGVIQESHNRSDDGGRGRGATGRSELAGINDLEAEIRVSDPKRSLIDIGITYSGVKLWAETSGYPRVVKFVY